MRVDDIHPEWQPNGWGPLARCCRALLHAVGWRLLMTVPHLERAVIVFYPHTSNWDFVIGLLARYGLGVPVTWAAKDSLFRGPFAALWRRLGGVPVNRCESTGFVGQMVAAFDARPMLLAIAPEGTRRWTSHWKSGAYRLALAARVPVALAFIDFARREVGVGALLRPTGDVDADFAAMRAFYADKSARRPAQAGAIVLQSRAITSSGAPGESAAWAERAAPAEAASESRSAPPTGP